MINVGIAGFGFAGRVFHAPVISAVSGIRLAAILQRSGSDAAELYPKAKAVRSLDELLTIPEIDLVVVATPNRSHFEIASECLYRGKHVVVDKPFTITVEEARALADLAASSGKVLSVYQNRRWDGDFLTVHKLIRDGVLGRIVLFESHFDRFRLELREDAWRERPEPGSGVLFDLGPHLLDHAMVLFGKPEAITADVRRERLGAMVDDAFDVTLFYPQMRVVLRASMVASAPGARFTLHGEGGSFTKHGMDPQEDALKRGERPPVDTWGREGRGAWGTLTLASGETRQLQTFDGNYAGYYENVRDAILQKAPLAVTPQHGIDVMIALELAQRSSREGRRIEWPS